MSSGASGSDEQISASKIDPLASETKANVPHDQSSRGVAGSDRNIDQARIPPLGGADRYKHPEPHASAGVVGEESNIGKTKIEPLEEEGSGDARKGGQGSAGLTDEQVDAARIKPLGEVREEIQ